jgi:hypothetical protein
VNINFLGFTFFFIWAASYPFPSPTSSVLVVAVASFPGECSPAEMGKATTNTRSGYFRSLSFVYEVGTATLVALLQVNFLPFPSLA